MSPELISMLLWIPFAIVALITGLIYCIGGYRRGLWRALGSLASVVLSTVLSVLLSRLIAGLAAPGIAAMIPMDSMDAVKGAAVQLLLVSAISVVLAMLLFGILMLIFTPVFSAIIGKLLGKRLTDVGKGFKWLGMATGMVSALVFSLFWLSPLYGTLATAAPVAQTLLSAQQEEGEVYAAYIGAVDDHLLVQVSGTGPVSMVYDGISQVPVGGSSVSVVEMSAAIEEAAALAEQLRDANDPESFTAIVEQLISLARNNFVEQDWFYEMSQGIVAELEKMAEDSTMEDIQYIRTALQLAKMPKEEFKEIASAVLELAQTALEKDLLIVAESGDPQAIYETGILQDMGKTFNSSPRMVQIKKLAIALMLEETGMTFEDSMALMETYQVGQLTEPEDQLLEVEALILPGLSRGIPPAVMILRHPSLGEAALAQVEEKVGFAGLMGYPGEELELSAKEEKALMDALKKASQMSFEEAAKINTGLNLIGNMAESAVAAS